jgi:hypothetical protein
MSTTTSADAVVETVPIIGKVREELAATRKVLARDAWPFLSVRVAAREAAAESARVRAEDAEEVRVGDATRRGGRVPGATSRVHTQ